MQINKQINFLYCRKNRNKRKINEKLFFFQTKPKKKKKKKNKRKTQNKKKKKNKQTNKQTNKTLKDIYN